MLDAELDAEGILDLGVLGQVTAELPAGSVEWIHPHQLASLDKAIQLAEDEMCTKDFPSI